MTRLAHLLNPRTKVVAACLLILYGMMAWSGVREKSNTFDEIAHLTGGYSYWKLGDFRLHPENGILPQRLVAIPLLVMELQFPDTDSALWRKSDVWNLGRQFFYESGNDVDRMLWWSRGMVVLLGVALGAVVFTWSRRLFGPAGALISLVGCVFCPSILAHGSLATSDMAATFFFIASLGCLWIVLHRVSAATVLASAAVMGCLFASKMSAVLILPIALLLIGIRLATGRPLIVTLGKKRLITDRLQQLVVLAGVLAFHAAAVILIIWTFYGFHDTIFRESQPNRDQLFGGTTIENLTDDSVVGACVRLAREIHLLPEAYLFGFAYAVRMSQARVAFLNGQFSVEGWRLFFPYSFMMKTPLAVMALLCLAAIGAVAKWLPGRDASRTAAAMFWRRARRGLYRTAPLWVFLIVYWFVAIRTNLNIGHRHILPTYPIMFILCGAAGYWFGRRTKVVAGLVLIVLATLAFESISIWPNYLAYFNRLAGGPRHGYRHLVDSSLDWGQDLPGLARWLAERQDPAMRDKPVYLAYFGTGMPEYYGIEALGLPSYMESQQHQVFPLLPGTYCISATMLQCVYLAPSEPWNVMYEVQYKRAQKSLGKLEDLSPDELKSMDQKLRNPLGSPEVRSFRAFYTGFEQLRMARLCAYLRQREPDDFVGYSILIYYLNEEDLDQALNRPIKLHSE